MSASLAISLNTTPGPLSHFVPQRLSSVIPCTYCPVRNTSVCFAVPEDKLGRLANVAVMGKTAIGHTIIDEGTPATGFYNLSRGYAKLYKMLPDGRRQITGFATPGDFLGLAVSEKHAFSAEALTPVEYCRFPRAGMTRLINDFDMMGNQILAVVSNELIAAREQMLLLGQKTAQERVASFLASWSRHGMPGNAVRSRFVLPMGREDVADYLGLTPETISRGMTKLRVAKLIATPNHRGIEILDHEGLERVASGVCP